MKKIGILTGGADCPGLNSVIRSVVRKAIQEGYVVTGIKNGWDGLVNGDMRILDMKATSGILDRGGTVLGTSRFSPPVEKEVAKKMAENFKRSGMDALIAVGGEDTLKIALDLYRHYSIPVVGVPKSIDNALFGTDYAFGFDTAVNIATECIDRLHTTAESHHRIMVIEVMGQYVGWIALEAGIAGGANITLVPEYPIDIDEVCESLKSRHKRGKTFSVIVVSEGAQIKDHPIYKDKERRKSQRSGNVGELLGKLIEEKTEYETRVSVLGHIQRGGTPTAYDRIIGTRFGVRAVELVKENKFGKMVSLHNNKIRYVNIEEAVRKRKTIDKHLYEIAKVFSA
ncbi:MAG: ATP-dependent 6-phosphofructokinase [Candidatus Zapsychrus exili]|nr:ATP-dependent 6-phosphofructokinase [Candidatus Zapsychrus exili]